MAVRTYFYHYVTAHIGADSPHILQALRSNLYHLGCRDIGFTNDIGRLREWVEETPPDLLIVQSDLGAPEDVCDLFRHIRTGNLGDNPFVPLVAVTPIAEPEMVKSLINAGADDILPYPWQESYLDQRLDRLIHQRKLFVVTSDYIGPDRRLQPRPSERFADVVPMEVPNPLRAKALDRIGDEALKQMVAEGAARVHTDRIRRLAELAVRLTGDLQVLAENNRGSSALARTCLERLTVTTGSILRRAEETPFAHVRTSCRTLNRTAKLMISSLEEAIQPELHLLRPLAERFAKEFGLDLTSVLDSPTRYAIVPPGASATFASS